MPTELDFFTFVYERQLIWYKRFILCQKQPWTSDPILQKYKIINMYRELDKCTTYIVNKLKNVSDRRKILLNAIFFRFFNRNNLYEELNIEVISGLDSKIKDLLIKKFNELKKFGPIFNNAYLISSGGKGVKHVTILENIARLNIDKMIDEIDKSTTPEESLDVLMTMPMIGPFLACEIWTDLSYFGWFKQKWNDDDFVNIGPGAKWGLEILYGRLLKKEMNEKLYHLHKIQRKVLPEIHEHLGKEFSWKDVAYKDAYSNVPFLSITNIEGALCEFRKYWRLKQGKGKKRYYHH